MSRLGWFLGVAILGLLALAPALSVSRVELPFDAYTYDQLPDDPRWALAIRLRCDVYDGAGHLTTYGCQWSARNTELLTVTPTGGRWAFVVPKRGAHGSTWVIASYYKRDSVQVFLP